MENTTTITTVISETPRERFQIRTIQVGKALISTNEIIRYTEIENTIAEYVYLSGKTFQKCIGKSYGINEHHEKAVETLSK